MGRVISFSLMFILLGYNPEPNFFEPFKTLRCISTYFRGNHYSKKFKIFNSKVTFFKVISGTICPTLVSQLMLPPPSPVLRAVLYKSYRSQTPISMQRSQRLARFESIDTVCLVPESGLFTSHTFGLFKRYLRGIRGF